MVGAKRVGGYGPGRRRRPARRVGGDGQSLERPRYNRVRTQYTAAVHSRGHDADSRRPRPLRYCRGPSRRDAASTSAPGQLAARRRRARRCAQLLRWYACVLHRTARRCDCTACRPHDGREASDKRRFPWRRPRSQQAEGAQNCRHDGPFKLLDEKRELIDEPEDGCPKGVISDADTDHNVFNEWGMYYKSPPNRG